MTKATLVLVLWCALLVEWPTLAQNCNFDNGYTHSSKKYGRKVHLKQGVIQGVVVEPRINQELGAVEQYLGIPYAAPPIGDLRFMPPGSAPAWAGIKCADMMGPVCPQRLPDVNQLDPTRKDHFARLLKHLQNQSEDCLYLNIYVPIQDDNILRSGKYPVMVYLHGESFEWGSGNPYDGSVLASYGKVIVVTLNYRLGILGFLKVGLEENSSSNFGLVDQVAALLWVQDNIYHFGGDPNSITLFGHGTGAACISFLMLSPMVPKEQKILFNRAILMSGTALSDWALASTPRQVTYQVAEALNCPTDDKLAACLRKKRLTEIMDVMPTTAEYSTKFGPIVDALVIPNDPAKIMSTYNEFFRRFEMMYGVTEVESINLLPPVGLAFGLLEKERDQELRKYFYAKCEYRPENCVTHTLAAYAQRGDTNPAGELNDGIFTGNEPDKASLARDMLLDMLSDARTISPMTLTARYHAAVNPQSYFYVFGHTTESRLPSLIRNKTSHAEELPYVFGVPLDGPRFHFTDRYTADEKLFAEVVMTLWTNFAYSGDPNVPRKTSYMTLTALDWRSYEVDWPEFDPKNERYLYLSIPLRVNQHYRSRQVNYWTEILPTLTNKSSTNDFFQPAKFPPLRPTTISPIKLLKGPMRNVPSWFPYGKGTLPIGEKFAPARSPESRKPNDEVMSFGTVKLESDPNLGANPIGVLNSMNNNNNKEFGTVIMSPPHPVKTGGTAMIVLIAVGGVFLLVNVILFVGLYYKCTKLKTREEIQKRIYGEVVADNAMIHGGISDKLNDELSEAGCGIMKMISKSSRSEDTYEAVKVSESGCGADGARGQTYKLSRQMSASTIDPHTKVRDWIVQRCSPKFMRKEMKEQHEQHEHLATINNCQKLLRGNQEHHALDTQHVRSDSKTTESYSTLGKSPTRPVSPTEALDSMQRKKEKVSVAVDATPAARSPSILRQQPIELTKSLDYSRNSEEPYEGQLKRSATESNLPSRTIPGSDQSETIVKIEYPPSKHQHSRSDGFVIKKMTTFDPNLDVNVTSKEEDDCVTPLTPEESLQTIKRRNFPKVLPDYPDRQNGTQTLNQKRRSMPIAPLFMPIPENPSLSQPNSPSRVPNRYAPAPPPRCSTLGRKPTNVGPFCQQSPVKLAEEPPTPSEPELACNNLYVGPLIPKEREREHEFDMQPIYDNLRIITQITENCKDFGITQPTTINTPPPDKTERRGPDVIFIGNTDPEKKVNTTRSLPRTIITADPEHPIRKVDPKVIIKPTISGKMAAAGGSQTMPIGKGMIPRVVMKESVGDSSSKKELPHNAGIAVGITGSSGAAAAVVTPKSQRKTSHSQEASSSGGTKTALEAGGGRIGSSKETTEDKTTGRAAAAAAAAAVTAATVTASQIPKLIKNAPSTTLNKESSSESSPSEESETGTVIKRL